MILVLCLALILIPLIMQNVLHRRQTRALPRPLDLGLVLVSIGVLYAVMPLIGIQLADWGIGAVADDRFSNRLLDLDEVVTVGGMYLAFVAGIAWAYLRTLTGSAIQQPSAVQSSRTRDVVAAFTLLCAIKLTVLLARLVLGIQTSEDYLGSYLELADQPLIVRQLYGLLSASELPASILAIVIASAHSRRLRRWVGVIVVAQLLMAITGGGSRTLAFVCALAYIVAGSMFDPRLKFSSIVAASITALLLFLVGGALRHATISSEEVPSLYLFQGGEFLTLFLNSLDLLDRLRDIDLGALRLGVYLVDLLRFVPQQIIGDLKLDPASFYVTTFYPDFAEAGGGLAFGAIAEATLGFGIAEAFVRGLLLGYLFARVRIACVQRRLSLIRAFVYTWFVVMAYQSVRDTTLSVFPRFFFQVLPLLIVMRALAVCKLPRAAGATATSREYAAPSSPTGPSRQTT